MDERSLKDILEIYVLPFIAVIFFTVLVIWLTVFLVNKDMTKRCEYKKYILHGYQHTYVHGIGCLNDEQYKRYLETKA